jgi:hypothetical protein
MEIDTISRSPRRSPPFPDGIERKLNQPDFHHERYANIPIAREPLSLDVNEHAERIMLLAQRKKMTVEQYVTWCREYAESSGSDTIGTQPLVYRFTDSKGKYKWRVWGRENLKDGVNLRAFDFLWSQLHRRGEIGWDAEMPAVDAKTGQNNLISKHYVNMHRLVCGTQCLNPEWHPSADQVLNVHGNLGTEESINMLGAERFVFDSTDELKLREEEEGEEGEDGGVLNIQVDTPTPLTQELVLTPVNLGGTSPVLGLQSPQIGESLNFGLHTPSTPYSSHSLNLSTLSPAPSPWRWSHGS